jgi:hypothetical protein
MITLLNDPNGVYKMALASERLRSLGLLDRIVRLVGSPELIFRHVPRYNKLLKQNGDVMIHGGYSETDRVRTLLEMGAGADIPKPYTLEEIGMTVRGELDRR